MLGLWQERLGASLARHQEQDIRDFLREELSSRPQAGGFRAGTGRGQLAGNYEACDLRGQPKSPAKEQRGQWELRTGEEDEERWRAWLNDVL
jgi:hypothetical protein